MKNYFFVNPIAGQGKGIDSFVAGIKASAEAVGAGGYTEIYITKAVRDCELKAREIAESSAGEFIKMFACGGDGTCNELVNGVIGFDNVSVGCVPIGTGNDTIRSLPGARDFLNIEKQLTGETHKIDLIKYSGIIDGAFQKKYCVNMFNIGFDCNVAALTARLKSKPLIAGSFAYLMAILGTFIKKNGISLKLEENGEILIDGQVLLCAIANGSYCGGGIYSSPQAEISDGIFDINIIQDVSRLTFLKLFPKYQKGTHLEDPRAQKVVSVKKSKSLTLTPAEEKFLLCADGEIYTAEKIDFEIVPEALNFIVPAE